MNLRFYRIGAWLWIMTGVVHTLGDVLSRLISNADEDAASATLRDVRFELLGMSNDYHSIVMAFSIAMGVSIALVGVLLLVIARAAAERPDLARTAGLVGLVASVGLLALTITVLKLPPPMVTFALATVAFAVALSAGSRDRAVDAYRH